MNKVFLYLYPIKEFSQTFNLGDDYYSRNSFRNPFDVLNEAIQKRYRARDFKIVFVLYPDKDIYGISLQQGDKIIYTDVTFLQATGYNSDGSEKTKEEIIYPDEQKIINQLGNVEELVIAGYHAQDCVKRVGEVALSNGIKTIIDLDLTDLFFNLYKQVDYFRVESYSPERFKTYCLKRFNRYGDKFAEEMFNRNYESEACGFKDTNKKLK